MRAMKIFVTVPRANAAALRDAIGEAGGGKIGNYSFCTFSVQGVGRFRPEEGSNPSIGELGEHTEVLEEKIEFVCAHQDLAAVIEAIKEVHSYEEPAIDAFEVEIF